MIIVQIAGRLGRDPETRFTASGQKVTNLTVATTVRKAGKEDTVWWRVTVWGERFDKMITFLKKGSAVIAVGEMNKPEIWVDKEGRPQTNLELTAEILRFSPFGNPDPNKPESANQSTHNPANQSQPSHNQAGQGLDTPYSDFGGNPNAYNNPTAGNNSPYGATQGTAQARYGQTIPHNEEQLPF